MSETNWIDVNEKLPEAKEGWNHSEQVFVHYDGIPNKSVESCGVAYYHYQPPYRNAGWINFNDSRQPTHWMPIPPIK